MFKGFNKITDTDIIIIDDIYSEDNIDEIKQLCRDKIIICPHCKSPLIARTGEIRRWHFAHTLNNDCPYKSEKAYRLHARNILYKFLIQKKEEELKDHLSDITIENTIDTLDIENLPIDCSFKYKDFHIAYFIYKNNIRHRYELLSSRMLSGYDFLNFLFIYNEEIIDFEKRTVDLTASQREVMKITKIDNANNKGKSLHFINTDDHTVVTLRDLHSLGERKKYSFEAYYISDIKDTKLYPKECDFVHPEELDINGQPITRPKIENKNHKEHYNDDTSSKKINKMQIDPVTNEEIGICSICGKKYPMYTDDWRSYTGKCNDCHDKINK